mmetsp:Transcript_40536/g.79312  ORF Transcript_40536/g.79312 Transcript_40536/m.79312 type:complete len:341 (+) Transcript_40536:67-1089(+)
MLMIRYLAFFLTVKFQFHFSNGLSSTGTEAKLLHASKYNSPRRVVNPRYPDFALDNYLANPYFQKINTDYPGLQLIHEKPFIFLVNDFFTDDECDRLINKAMEAGLRRQIGGGSVVRTSNGVVCENEEVPTIRRKMADLTNISDLRQLQHLKVSRYSEGQEFSKHTDAWPTEGAPISRGWVFEDDFFGDRQRPVLGCVSSMNKPLHNNFMTSFVYLNDVPIDYGGCTSFPNIGLHTGKSGASFYDEPAPMDARRRSDGSEWDWDFGSTLKIHPQRGTAVLHFCSLLPEHGGLCDGNTFHRAEPPKPGHEKFVSQQFFSSCPFWDIPDDSLPFGRVSSDTI